jgi:hypothetical protein
MGFILDSARNTRGKMKAPEYPYKLINKPTYSSYLRFWSPIRGALTFLQPDSDPNHRENIMKYLRFLLAASCLFGTPLAISDDVVIDTPMAATTLQFADRYASIFYVKNEDFYKVVFAFSTGKGEKEQLIRQSLQLADGQSFKLSIGGYGANEQASTISIRRKDEHILAGVVSCESKQTMANCI